MIGKREKGIWKLSKFVGGDAKRLWELPNGGWERVHNIHNEWNDCDGDVLFDYMIENDLIDSFENYETDGDNEHVAIMHKTGDGPDWAWDFKAYAPPGPASDDCHTYS